MTSVVLAVWGASAILGISIFLTMTKRQKNKKVCLCDSCDRLKERRPKESPEYTYVCSERGSFNYAREFCTDYMPFEPDKADEQSGPYGDLFDTRRAPIWDGIVESRR